MSRLATLRDGGRDGTLVVLSADHERYQLAPVQTLQIALERWDAVAEALAETGRRLDEGAGERLEIGALHAPMPRSYQYCEGSTYLSHMERCRAARGVGLPPGHGVDPAVLQGAGDRFLAPTDDIELHDESWGLDLETTITVVVSDVPQGASPAQAQAAIRLLMLANDLTLRNIIPAEFAKGIGFFQAKPLRPFAPVAVTPDELGDAWDGRLLHATVKAWVGEELLGELDCGHDTSFDFVELIVHATRTRPLAAGTIVGSGTISNVDAGRGFGCLAEKRAMEILEGRPPSSFLRVGDTVRIEAFDDAGDSIFGAMQAAVVGPSGGSR